MHQVLLSSPKKIEAEIAAAKNNGLNNGSGDLQKAADKITLMSPDVFEVKPKIEENENLLTTPTRFVMLATTILFKSSKVLSDFNSQNTVVVKYSDIQNLFS
jgi:hypothetical protein